MPFDDPDPQDPNMLVGVGLPGDRQSTRDMALAFAEEFAALGFGEEQLWRLFRVPGYRAAHRAYQALGEEEIRALIAEALSFWGQLRVRVEDAARPGTATATRPLVTIRRLPGNALSRAAAPRNAAPEPPAPEGG